MKLIFELGVSKILFINLLCVQCHPVLYPSQRMSNEYRFSPLAHRYFSPMDDYRVPSTQAQTRMYPGAPSMSYVEEPRDTINTTLSFNDFINVLEYLHEQPRDKSDHKDSSYFSGLRDSTHSPHGIKSDHIGDIEAVSPTKTTFQPKESNGMSVSFLKPDWDSLTKPATTSMDNWSGLFRLILAFITGLKSGNHELKGFQDIILNGILKPILVAKGNIKSFLSKITIPLVSLLLINIEVLFTVWWLWEDCPKESKIGSMDQFAYNHTDI